MAKKTTKRPVKSKAKTVVKVPSNRPAISIGGELTEAGAKVLRHEVHGIIDKIPVEARTGEMGAEALRVLHKVIPSGDRVSVAHCHFNWS